MPYYLGSELDDWDEYLPAVQFAYNTSKHATTQHTPFEVLHGYNVASPASATLGIGHRHWHVAQEHARALRPHVQGRREIDCVAKDKAARRDADKSVRGDFAVGQFVFRKNERMINKLDARLLGPYVVTKVLADTDNYVLRSKGGFRQRLGQRRRAPPREGPEISLHIAKVPEELLFFGLFHRAMIHFSPSITTFP